MPVGNSSWSSGVKSEVTLVPSQSAIGEINLATELQGTIGNDSLAVPASKSEATLVAQSKCDW